MKIRIIRAMDDWLARKILRWLWHTYPRLFMVTALGKEKYHIHKNPPKRKIIIDENDFTKQLPPGVL